MKRVKLVFESKIRKYEVPLDQSHMHVKKLIEKTTADCGFIPVLQYMDEDKDWITIGTEADLALCLQTNSEPKIFIFKAQDAVASRNKADKDLEEEDGWVQFDAISESPEVIPVPPMTEPEVAEAAPAPDAEGADLTEAMHRAAQVLLGNARPNDSEPMQQDEKEDEKEPSGQPSSAFGGFDWNTLVEDLLANQRALSGLVSEVYEAVEKGGDVKSAVLKGLLKEPFKSHPFVKNGKPDLEKMLGKVNHMSALVLQAGKSGMEMALPLILRGFAKMKMGGGNVVDMAPAFMTAFPGMSKWLSGGLKNNQEATFDLGAVLRHMVSQHMKPRGGEADGPCGEPAEEDPEVAAAAKDGIVLHKGITCDLCDEKPIIGIRYKCMICPDFDMCQECKKKGKHPSEHPLITMNKPAPRGGFKLGHGHYKGATEMFKGPGGRGRGMCGGKWGGPGMGKRRAMKKLWKWKNKCGDNKSNCSTENNEEGRPEPMFGGRGGRFGPMGRRGHRHHPFAPPPHHAPPGAPEMAPGPPPNNGRWAQTTAGGYDSDSSSSSSSSSESEGFRGHHSKGRKHSPRKHSHKKGKKHLKRLMKKRHKVCRKIEKTAHRHRKLGRRLNRLHNKEAKLNRLLSEVEQKRRNEQNQGPPNANQPGHDPNPNRGPPRPHFNGAHWPFNQGGWPFQQPPMMPPPHRPPHQQAPEPRARDDYSTKLALLVEMGFTDAATCKRLLKETKGDVKSVIMMMSLGNDKGKSPYPRQE